MFGNAEGYERFMGRWSRLLAPLLVDFTDVPEEGRALDVGSGTGSLSAALAKRKDRIRITGIDPSKEYVGYANARNPAPDRISFQIGDAQQLQFPDATFDASLSLLVFNFIPDPMKALREVRRTTKPGGRISAAVWDYGGGMRMLRVFWDAVTSLDAKAEALDEKHMLLGREGQLGNLWRRGGLTDLHEQPLDISMRFSSFTDYWDTFMLAQGPAGAYLRSLDRDRLETLRGELRSRLAVSPGDNPLDLPARAWAVRGSVPKGD